MRSEIRVQPFDAWREVAAYEREHADLAARCGAAALFVGRMRADNQGQRVTGMFLEHYPGMTERYLAKLCAEAEARWKPWQILLLHRVGAIAVGDDLVLVAVWSPHRAAALAACRYLIEELKQRAPLWKKELLAGGRARWVERNTPAEPALSC